MLEKEFETLKSLEYGPDVKGLTAEVDKAIAKSKDDPQSGKAIERGLLGLLNGDSTHNAKDFACRKLKVVGGEAAVPTLAKLLSDEKLGHMARYALESMPIAAASKALLKALPQVSGKLKAGVISSLGTRQEDRAVASLAALLNDKDAVVARAAASALGAIRSESAANALSNAKPHPEAISLAVDSALACAESLLSEGEKMGALKIYQQLMKGDQPKHVKLAATRGVLACKKS